mgnify:CR=1 FL=1
MTDLRILEWNINHRLGRSKANMPEWVADVIRGKDADIVILTECCNRISNWETEKNKAFAPNKYLVFTSNNNQGNQNDVTIAIKKEKIEVLYSKSFFSKGHKVPDHLQLKCRWKENEQEFTVVGMRIHAMISDEQKYKQFDMVINDLKEEKVVIIGGDFNNNRRSYCKKDKWNLKGIDEYLDGEYIRITPEGSSIYRDVDTEDDYCFAEDHFFVKGIKNIDVKPYDRNFVDRDKGIYKWGSDFQAKDGWEKPENKIPDPYPDHAILEAEFIV